MGKCIYIWATFEQYPELKIAVDHLTLTLARCLVNTQGNKKLWNLIKVSSAANNRKVYVDNSVIIDPEGSENTSNNGDSTSSRSGHGTVRI